MRNLHKFPITKSEILDALYDARYNFQCEAICGDTRPAAVDMAIAIVRQCPQDEFTGDEFNG